MVRKAYLLSAKIGKKDRVKTLGMRYPVEEGAVSSVFAGEWPDG